MVASIGVTDVDGGLKCKPLARSTTLSVSQKWQTPLKRMEWGPAMVTLMSSLRYAYLSPRQHAVSRGMFGGQDPSCN